ncbi:uncharacterized protein M421DRAFT_421388 [Didymella exigua CBS 183.55]|uniref:Uncharacterized protein n=1 Tax=Didymella exigua CBS 183.55 TaxID=1150837 RepID=A0A6A5RME9_9PLEO|nr:uncharacterized protein M421DRAFT_421388 [Didymella exigua CBS 183.55]KAF1927546.1 hypothetical protein M421DRAFT_421388 [Didymella exigua CBS 183.55]
MNIAIPSIRKRAASRDTTPSLPSSQSSNSSHGSETTALERVKQVILCCKRHIERFASAPRSAVYEDEESVDSSSCFELRRPKSNSLPTQLPSQTHPRRAHASRPIPLNVAVMRQQSYQFYMDDDNHPFITTPSCMEGDSSQKSTTFITPTSR